MPFLKKRLKYLRPVGLFALTLISVVTLNSCAIGSSDITLTSGSDGSGYQRISEQITESAAEEGEIKVVDNYNSQGSLQNLERLLNKEVDFAILQLDVASEAMKEGKVSTLLILTEEYIHVIARSDSNINDISDLQGKRVAMGAEGSGIYFTAKRLFELTNLQVQQVITSGFSDGLQKLVNNELDAVVYVGPLGASERVRTELRETPNLSFVSVNPSLINYLQIQYPESYRGAEIIQGTYKPIPDLPGTNIPTVSTPGALVTRPDVSRDEVALLTWSILANFRQYAPFYAKLAQENDKVVMHEGLIYTHPGARQVFDGGDPRDAWLRYIQQNQPLQSGLIMLIGTSSIGFFLRWSRKNRSANLIKANKQAIADLRATLEKDPQTALANVEALRQKYRLMLIDGLISVEIYEQIERMTEVFVQQCQTLQQQKNCESIDKILGSIDEWQQILKTNSDSSEEKLEQLEHKYKQMLLSGQINMDTYIRLKQLDSIMAMFYKSSEKESVTKNNSQV